ncbi:death-associated protein kinase 3-like isoform X2 [Cimex lectularius]|nr:death-associated protein kinase 3-like isoform X2 [Cimex lectularius]
MFASVWRCRSLANGEVYAAKFSSRKRYGEDCTREIHHEIALLSLCSPSPRIVKLHDVFQTPNEFIIVMEFAPGGDMQTLIDDNLVPYERDVVKYVQDVVEGLAYLHHRKIAHLDIKPQNLVMMGDFPDCEVKVCDFEISRVILDGTEVHEILGTPEYVAPEILHYEPITLAADMWSLGVTTYVLLTGFSPFGGETDQETFLNISKAQVDFPDELFEDISEEAKDFVRRLLLRKPSERMTAKEALKHPWLSNARKCSRPCMRANRNQIRRGCTACPSHSSQFSGVQESKATRSYLSKSREALFEKVMSRGVDLRKRTLVQQYSRARRMYESQVSLGAGDKSLMLSREKLYGLKSLSKSQEVLSLYRSVLNLSEEAIVKANGETQTDNKEEEKKVAALENNNNNSTKNNCDEDKEEDKPEEQKNSNGRVMSPVTTEPATTSESDEDSITSVESRACEDTPTPATVEEEEPKFTVAQLVSAYDRHQEIVTKSSIEVTMRSGSIEEKFGNKPFPTGPNALRLFIPDIQLRKSKRKKKRMPRVSTGLPQEPVKDLDLELESDKKPEAEELLSERLGAEPTVPKYLRSETTPEPKIEKKKPPYYMTPLELKQHPMSNVAKTVELFNNFRPDRKSFSSSRSPLSTPESEKSRRKSSPPTMKPF